VAGCCGAIEGLIRGLAAEIKPIRFNTISLGPILTQAIKDILGEHYGTAIKVAKQKALVRKVGQPGNVV
jgi:NAD(P)-dependent dehydrogenase (short-subunit alcohol dehydrogenase family)